MKKFFLGTLAALAMVACANEEVLRQSAANQIAFQNSYVENSTVRNSVDAGDPSYTTADLDAFDVWGFMDVNSGVVFSKERVTRGGDTTGWTYANKQYWTANHKYWFAALAPVDHTNVELTLAADPYMTEAGLGKVTFSNIDGTDDLIYAEATATTPAEITSAPDPVQLAFNHLLSKVRFSFKNGFTNENATLIVEDVKMVVPGKGEIDLTQDAYTWTLDANAADVTLDLGDMNAAAKVKVNEIAVSDYHRMTIPASASESYVVTFKVSLYMGDTLAGSWDRSTTVTGCELVAGKKYNFHATLTAENVAENALYPIEFTASVVDWENPEIVYDGGNIETEDRVAVATIDELQAALDNATEDVDIVLSNDLAGNVTAVQKEGVNVSIDGAGYKYDGTITIHGQARYKGEETLLIKNVNFETATKSMYFIDSNSTASAERYAHNVYVQNCTFTATDAAVHTAVAMRVRQGYNINVLDCTATDTHSLLQGYGISGVNVERTNVSGKNGISLGTSLDVLVKNSTISTSVAYAYGIRSDASVTTALTVSGCDITAGAPVLLRKASGAYTLNVENSTLTTNETYQVIACANDYEDGVTLEAATGAVVLNGVDGYTIFK